MYPQSPGRLSWQSADAIKARVHYDVWWTGFVLLAAYDPPGGRTPLSRAWNWNRENALVKKMPTFISSVFSFIFIWEPTRDVPFAIQMSFSNGYGVDLTFCEKVADSLNPVLPRRCFRQRHKIAFVRVTGWVNLSVVSSSPFFLDYSKAWIGKIASLIWPSIFGQQAHATLLEISSECFVVMVGYPFLLVFLFSEAMQGWSWNSYICSDSKGWCITIICRFPPNSSSPRAVISSLSPRICIPNRSLAIPRVASIMPKGLGSLSKTAFSPTCNKNVVHIT